VVVEVVVVVVVTSDLKSPPRRVDGKNVLQNCSGYNLQMKFKFLEAGTTA
jgi:hypothetical protein